MAPAAGPCAVLRCGRGKTGRSASLARRFEPHVQPRVTRAEVTPVQATGSGRVVALMTAISRALAEGPGVDATLQGCAEALVRHLGAAFARVWLCRPDDDVLRLRASAGLYTHLDGSHSRIRVGELKIGRIAAERRPHLTNAVLDDPAVDDRTWARREGMVAFAGYPLLVDGRTVGVMALFAREPLSADVLEALAAIADAMAQYVERDRAEAELRRAHVALEQRVEEGARQLATLLEVGRELASTHELGPLLRSLLGRLQAVVAYDGAAILLQEGEELCYAAVGGPDRWEEARHVRYPLADFLTAWERLRRDEPILVGDVLDETPDARLFRSNTAGETGLEFIRSLLWVPLVVRDGIIGLLSIARCAPHAFTPPDAELALAIARQAAVAIENARLHERARDAAVLEERQRLARELHDSVTQALYSLKLYAEAAGRQLDAGDPSTARAHLREVRASAGEALSEMRLLLHELRPPLLREHGLGPALRARLAAVEGRSGLVVEARLGDDIRLPAPVEQDLYRIAQEALNNVLKHARASRVTLAFEAADGCARLEVADDGAGFDSDQPGGGLGLAGMRERAAHVGGALRIESAPGAGTRIVVEVPR